MKKGETRELIILDHSLEEGVALYEHQYEVNGNWGNFEMCLREATNCPICLKLGKQSSYVNYISVLDLTGYVKRNKEVVGQSKALLGIKGTSLDKFKQLQAIALSQGKSLRGMFLRMSRPLGNDNSARIGEPQMLTECGGAPFYIYTEEEMLEAYGHEAIIGRDGKTIIKAADSDLQPYPWDLAFPAPNIPDVFRRWGVELPLGMQADEELRDVEEQHPPAAPASPRRSLPPGATAAPAPVAAPGRPSRAAPVQQQAAAPTRAAPARGAPQRQAAPAQEVLDDPDAGGAAGEVYEPEGDDPLE